MNMYNNVTSEYLKDINQSYVQIKSISEEGEIESVTWPNYQTYLLSNIKKVLELNNNLVSYILVGALSLVIPTIKELYPQYCFV